MRRQRRHRGQEARLGAGGQLQAGRGNGAEQPPMLGGEARYLAAARRRTAQGVVAVGAGAVGRHAQHHAAVGVVVDA